MKNVSKSRMVCLKNTLRVSIKKVTSRQKSLSVFIIMIQTKQKSQKGISDADRVKIGQVLGIYPNPILV